MPRKNQQKRKTRVPKTNTRKLRGKGDYAITGQPEAIDAIHDIDRRLARMETRPSIGQSLGGAIGARLGNRQSGASLGKHIEQLFGFGDYTIKSNSLFTSNAMGQSMVPQFSNQGRTITVRVREFITDVKAGPTLSGGSTTFAIERYRINPSDPVTFPWLGTIATQFDQWEPSGIVFEFRSTSSEYNGTNQSLGTVIMATQYDVADTVFVDKPTMEASDYANSVKPSESALHGIECSPKERPTEVLYCGTATTGYDARMYDLGYFSIATQGCSAANVNLGELWISYDISFYKKSKNYPIMYYAASFTSGAGLFITKLLEDTMNNFKPTFSNNTMTFPSTVKNGTYFVVFAVAGAGVQATTPASTNCTLSPLSGVTSTGAYSYQYFTMTITAGSATITFVSAGTLTSCAVRVFQGYSGMLLQ